MESEEERKEEGITKEESGRGEKRAVSRRREARGAEDEVRSTEER